MRKQGLGLGWKIIIGIALCLGGGMVSGLFTGDSIDKWYVFLDRPSFTPRAYVFPIVWTILYTLMGISFALAWHSPRPRKARALGLFFLQLFFNFAWTFLFFYMRSPFLGLIDLSLLLIILFLTIGAFGMRSRTAAILLIPYFAWVIYAWLINFYIWMFNK